MEYRRLGRTHLMVSEIGLGALEIGRDWGIRVDGDFGRPDEADAIQLIHTAIDLGITFIDTAPAYQLSEERIGKALQGRRDAVYLATKVGEHYNDQRGFWYDASPDACRRSIEQSLRHLQTDVIDLLQIHSASTEMIEQGEVLSVMQEFQQDGHVRFVGMSGDIDAARAAIKDGHYDTVQVPYNILDRRAERELFSDAREQNVGVIIMLPLGQGTLTGKREHLDPNSDAYRRSQQLRFLERPDQTLAQAALRFVLGQDAVSSVIAGTRKVENLRANVAAAAGRLTEDEMQRINALEG